VLQVRGRGQRGLLPNDGILNFLSSKFRHGSASPELMTLHKFEWSADPALVSVRQDTEIVGKCLDFEPVVKSMAARWARPLSRSFWRWAEVMSCMCSIPVWADPSGPFTEQTHRAGSARSRTQLINARSARIEAAAPVTAALRWRGRCGLKVSALWQRHRRLTASRQLALNRGFPVSGRLN
jgi:hypothetical protein